MAPVLYSAAESASAIEGVWAKNNFMVTWWMDDAVTTDDYPIASYGYWNDSSYAALAPFGACGGGRRRV